jgi:hypothetical protein
MSTLVLSTAKSAGKKERKKKENAEIGLTQPWIEQIQIVHNSPLFIRSRQLDSALVCLIEGESVIFDIMPTVGMIKRLKVLIKEMGKNGVFSNVDAKDLTLWKVGMSIHGQRQHN